MSTNTESVVFFNAINFVSVFYSNTSSATKFYALGVGCIASSCLLNYYAPVKTCALVGRCASLFMAGELLHSQLDESWLKIAVTATKTTSICLGIVSIALSSPSLLVNSLICDVVGQVGTLGLKLCDLNASNQTILESLLRLTTNLLILGAISTSSANLLVICAVLNFIGSYIITLVSFFSFENFGFFSSEISIDAINRVGLVFPIFLYYVLALLYVDPANSLDDSMVREVAPVFPSINFRFDIFSEWNQTTQ